MSVIRRKIKKAAEIWRKGGLPAIRKKINHLTNEFLAAYFYRKQAEQNDSLTDDARETIRREIAGFARKPLISIVMPVYNVEERWLRRAVESVQKQLYENWEFCIADDASPGAHVRQVLEEYARRDSRIKLVFRAANGHISAASNSALALATGEYTALLDHDDEYAEDALFRVAEEINRFPEVELIYTDEDKIDEDNTRRFAPARKPDWSPDLLYSVNLVTHLAVFRTATLRTIGGFREGVEGSQDYDLVLRFYEQISDEKVRRIPRILYHWRAIRGSIALDGKEKSYAHERARKALAEHLERKGKKAKVVETVYDLHRVVYELPDEAPKIDLILNASDDKDIRTRLENIFDKTAYSNFQILLGTNSEEPPDDFGLNAKNFSSGERLKIIYSKRTKANLAAELNEIAAGADGDILVFLEGDIAPLNDDWLREMASFAYQKEIGAVGAKLFFPDETVRSGGILFKADGSIEFAHRDLPRNAPGEIFRACVAGNFPAVSGACLAIRREVFAEIGGFDHENYPNGLHDVDLCRRLSEKNYRVVFTPYAELVQFSDSATEKILRKINSKEVERFKKQLLES